AVPLPLSSPTLLAYTTLVRSLLLDLDDFKKINDSLGHDVGDQILTQVAERILELGRIYDTLYRLGGDEFVLLLENTNDVSVITRSEEHTSELQSRENLVCRLL